MTRSGERSALGPDPVPVHHRIRELLARHPEGPLPEAELESIRKTLKQPRLGSIRLRPGLDARRQSRRLTPEQNAIASHLLRTGTTSSELMVGLDLVVEYGAEVDGEVLRELALLDDRVGYRISTALRYSSRPAHDLYWVIARTPRRTRDLFVSSLGLLPREQVDSLLETLTVQETVALVLMAADLRPAPKWLIDHEPLRKLLRAVAEEPTVLEPGPAGLVDLVRLWDETRYGGCVRLSSVPEEQAAVAAGFRAALAGPGVLAEVERALAKRPDSSFRAWMRRRIEEARTGPADIPPGFAVRVAVPPPDSHREPELHVVVDGEPLATSWFGRGHPHSPEDVLDLGPGLRGGAEPVDVRLSEADCVEECCGAFRAVIHRDEAAGTVEWEVRDTGPAKPKTRRFSFPSEDYDAELDRALADRSWEWPARRAARLLRAQLKAEPELLGRWDCRPGWIGAPNRDRNLLEFTFLHPRVWEPDGPRLQFKHAVTVADAFEVDDRAVAAVVDRIVDMLNTTDPKTVASVIGGSRESAEALGFPWPG
jgi:hypothetical protein